MVWDLEVGEICQKGVGVEIQLINKELLAELHRKAAESERLRQNFDL